MIKYMKYPGEIFSELLSRELKKKKHIIGIEK